MKHYLSTILLCGAAASLAIAQTIVVVGKDGKSTVFNAEEVQEITFEEKPAVETINYSTIDATAYGGKDYVLKFTGDELPTISIELYTEKPWLEEGTYTVGASTGLLIDTNESYSYVEDGGSKQALSAGEMSLKYEGVDCVMDMNFILADGSEFKAAFKGEVPVGKKDATYIISSMQQLEVNGWKAGEFYLKFSDAAWTLEGVLDFFLVPGTLRVPTGVYNLSEDPAEPCYGVKSAVDFYSPINETYKITSPVTVEDDGENTRITFEITTPEGRVFSMIYDGQIEYLPAQLDEVVELTSAKINFNMGNNYEVYFKTEEGEQVNVEFYVPMDASGITAGTYTVDFSGKPMTIATGNGLSYVLSQNNKTGFKSGTMTIEEVENGFKVDFDLILSGDIPYKATYTGAITK